MKRNSIAIKILLVILCIVLLLYLFTNIRLVEISENTNVVDKHLLDLLKVQLENRENQNLLEIVVPQSCGKFPTSESLNISDRFWQVTNTTNGTFYLFSAYLNDREAVNGSVVRILGMINKIRPTVKTYCQMWFFGMLEPLSVEVYE